MKKVKQGIGSILGNYKTSLVGVVALVSVGLLWTNVINESQFTIGTGLLISIGFLASKDSNK